VKLVEDSKPRNLRIDVKLPPGGEGQNKQLRRRNVKLIEGSKPWNISVDVKPQLDVYAQVPKLASSHELDVSSFQQPFSWRLLQFYAYVPRLV
jgi:hypothetical protein